MPPTLEHVSRAELDGLVTTFRGEMKEIHGVLGRMAEHAAGLGKEWAHSFGGMREEMRVGFVELKSEIKTLSKEMTRVDKDVGSEIARLERVMGEQHASLTHDVETLRSRVDQLRERDQNRTGAADVLLKWLPWAITVGAVAYSILRATL